jgi:hypothetical protein
VDAGESGGRETSRYGTESVVERVDRKPNSFVRVNARANEKRASDEFGDERYDIGEDELSRSISVGCESSGDWEYVWGDHDGGGNGAGRSGGASGFAEFVVKREDLLHRNVVGSSGDGVGGGRVVIFRIRTGGKAGVFVYS